MLNNRRVLFLNYDMSGINTAIIRQLEKRGWKVIVFDVPEFFVFKVLALFLGFHFDLKTWRSRASVLLGKLRKTSWAYLLRTKQCQKIVKKYEKQIDLIFQTSSMFMPAIEPDSLTLPYVIYTNYTMKLTEKYKPWMPFRAHCLPWYQEEKKLYRNAYRLFTGSDHTRQSFIRDYGVKEKQTCLVNCAPTKSFQPVSEKTYDGKTILFVGLDFERKGGFILLDAFVKVQRKVVDARLLIVGPSLEKYHIGGKGVIHMGRISDREELDRIFKEASVFVMPSLCEPFGLVFLEAFAFKLPCIATNVDAMPSIIIEGSGGYLVAPNDIEALAAKIILLLQNPEYMIQMGSFNYQRLQEVFNWDVVMDKIEAEITSI
jgi:glycosyltransferase involved in cell wall biosynthesis